MEKRGIDIHVQIEARQRSLNVCCLREGRIAWTNGLIKPVAGGYVRYEELKTLCLMLKGGHGE
jgi:hypothetical protein